MLAYMLERCEQLKSPASLWCEYSMVKATINCNKNIDISKFPKLIGFLKSKNKGYQPKKSAVLEREEIWKFLVEADDEMYLLIKTVMIVGIAGACRTDEFCKMNLADITDHGQYVIIKIPQTKNDIPRSFTIVENADGEIDHLRIFKKYYEVRKKLGVATNNRFFMRYQNSKCCNQPVGEHTFAKMPAIITKFLNLPDANLYTGHSFRRSSATLLVNAGGNILDLKRHGAWKSSSIAECYVADSVKTKLDVANKILNNKSENCCNSRISTPDHTTTILEMPSTSSSYETEAAAPSSSDNSHENMSELKNSMPVVEVSSKHEELSLKNETFMFRNS